jgi:nitrogenase molybdenum-cofactor synthesis protein NifE
MTGDDINAVCKAASAKFGTPCIPVNSPGFVGPKNLGNKLAGEALLDHVIGTVEPEITTPYDLNIIGEYNLSGELWQVKPLFDELGIRISACISGDGRYKEVASSHRARAAMMVCSKAMINVARKMEERYGIPFFEGSFYGIQDSSDSLREIARLLVERGAPADLLAQTEAVIAREEAKAWAAIEPFKKRLNGKKVLLITGGVKSWSVVAALQEAGMELVGTSVKKSTKEDKERIKELMGQDAHMIEDMAPREMYKMLKDAKADIMLSGGKSQFVALKAAMPWLDINQERSHAYMGYIGMVELVAEIDKAIYNPMWEQLRKPAPWEQEGGNWQTRAIAQADAEAAALAADPVAAEAARRAKKVCNCKIIDLGTIEDAIAAHGLTTVEGVRERTSASGGCGACTGRVEDILARMRAPAPMLQAAE